MNWFSIIIPHRKESRWVICNNSLFWLLAGATQISGPFRHKTSQFTSSIRLFLSLFLFAKFVGSTGSRRQVAREMSSKNNLDVNATVLTRGAVKAIDLSFAEKRASSKILRSKRSPERYKLRTKKQQNNQRKRMSRTMGKHTDTQTHEPKVPGYICFMCINSFNRLLVGTNKLAIYARTVRHRGNGKIIKSN